jgi:single-strand DNA-binding protein
MSYERIILVGNLGDTPEKRDTNGQPVTSFSVAVNRKRSGQKATTWYRRTAWGVVAEHAVEYLKKGSRVLVEGSGLRASAYLGKDGQPHASLELTADRITFLDSAPSNDGEDDEIPM